MEMNLTKGNHMKGEIEILTPKVVYENQFAKFYDDKVIFPSGVIGSYIRMSYTAPFSVGVFPVLENGKVQLVKTFRHGARSWGLEIPKGFGNPGETFLQAAMRELSEETGLISARLDFIGRYYDAPSLNGDPLYCFIARDCRQGETQHLDWSEPNIKTVTVEPACYNLSDGYGYTDNMTELFLLKYIRGEWNG